MHVAIVGPTDLVWDERGLAIRRDGVITRAPVTRSLPFELVDESWLAVAPSGRRAWASTPLFTDPETGSACVSCDLDTGAVTTDALFRRVVRAGPGELLAAGVQSSLDHVARRVVRRPYVAFVKTDASDALPDDLPPSIALPDPITSDWPIDDRLAIWKTPIWSARDWSRPVPRRSPAGWSVHDAVSGLVLRIAADGSTRDVIRVPTEDGTETHLDAAPTTRGVLVCSSHGKGVSALLHFDRTGAFLAGHAFSGLATPPVVLDGNRVLVGLETDDDTSRIELALLDLATMKKRASLTTPLRATNGYPALCASDDGTRILVGDGASVMAGRVVGDALDLDPLDLG